MGAVSFTKPRQLRDEDDLEGFTCGLDLVDAWLQTRARTARKNGSAVVYVTFDAEGKLAGFYTLSSQSIARAGVGGWLARNSPKQIPVILLGMLGVHTAWQGSGLGRQLLLDAVHRAQHVADTIGARALVVDPADEHARQFYERVGFRAIPGSERLFAKLTA